MKNSLWKRVVFGYLIIALFMLAMSFYLIFRLHYLNKITDLAMKVNIPSIESAEKLLDNLLEQVRNEKKYVITNDGAFLDLFDKKKREFLDRIKFIEDSTSSANRERKALISQIRELHNKYLAIVSKEVILADADENGIVDAHFEEEKKKNLDQLTESINKLVFVLQTSLIKRVEMFQKVGYKSTNTSLAIILVAVLFGVIFAYFFTRSVCLPINVLKNATERIAEGDLDHRIDVTSRDEIGMLGTAFNQMCDKLKEMDLLKSEFVSNISHNLKTPLTAIREANDLMLDKIAGPISDPQTRLLTIIKEEAHQLTMMINDLLDLSRVEAGLMRYNFQITDVHDIIRKSIDEIRFLAENKNIRIQWGDGSPIPAILLDRGKIAQVMDNLLSNAIKFTPPEGSITIRAEVVESLGSPKIFGDQGPMNAVHSFVKISVLDTGIGIPEECHEKIFDRFQQVNYKGTGGIKGTGLGLSIAKHIVLDHGGNIWVESNPGKGSAFHFTLPCKYSITL